jgi:hypothetical protein
VNAVQIAEISKEIAATSERVKILEQLLKNIQETFERWQYKNIITIPIFNAVNACYVKIILELLDSQKLWLSKKIPEITEGIETYLEHHGIELKAMDNELARQAESTENASGQ